MAMQQEPFDEGWRKLFASDRQELELLTHSEQSPEQRVISTSDAFFRRFLMLWIACAALASLYAFFWAPGALYASVIALLSGMASKTCLHTGRTTTARWLFVLPMALTTMLAPWWINGIRTPVLANMAMLLVLAGWMLGRRAMWCMAVAFFVSLTTMWWAEMRGLWVMPVSLRNTEMWLIVLSASMFACVLATSELIGNYLTDMRRESAWQERLQSSLQFASMVIDRSPVPIRVFNHTGACVAVNEAYVQLMGEQRADLMQQNLRDAALHAYMHLMGNVQSVAQSTSVKATGQPSTPILLADCLQVLDNGEPVLKEVQVQTQDGRQLWLQAHLVPFERQGHRHLLAHFMDITERQRATQELQQIAFHDSLTGLANRRLFFEHLNHTVAQSRRSKEWGAVLLLDLNRFKQLNDEHGHEAGDQLLVEVARRMQATVRDSDVVARLGGDEFTVLLYPLGTDEVVAQHKAQELQTRLHHMLAQPYLLPGILHHGSASIGCAWIDPAQSNDVEALVREADAQMYAAKQASRSATHPPAP